MGSIITFSLYGLSPSDKPKGPRILTKIAPRLLLQAGRLCDRVGLDSSVLIASYRRTGSRNVCEGKKP